MRFLVWGNEVDAEASLAAVNLMYGCPYEHENSYRMDQWATVIPSNDNSQYGFYKPEERLDKNMDVLMPVLVSGYVDHDEMPDYFKLEEEDF